MLKSSDYKKVLKENVSKYGKGTGVAQILEEARDIPRLVTNSYMAVTVTPAVVGLFRTYNLEPEPGVYEVNGTITRTEQEPAKVVGIVPASDTLEELERATIHGWAAHVVSGTATCEVWETAGTSFVFRRDYAEILRDAGAVTFHADPRKVLRTSPARDEWVDTIHGCGPVVGRDSKGQLVGLIMPVRPANLVNR